MQKLISTLLFLLTFLCSETQAQIIQVGSGSYTTTFPGKDEAGRNDFPSGSPQLSGNAMGRPVATNDWWSKIIKENHADNLFNYPFSMRTSNEGLVVGNVVPVSTPNGSSQPFGDGQPIIVGLEGLNASRTTVADYSDWTVTMNWNQNQRNMMATSGIGMPFLYFTKSSNHSVEIEINEGVVIVNEEIIIVENSQGGADFVIYAPSGSTWMNSGNIFTSDLNGSDYWSLAMLPENSSPVEDRANYFKRFAYVFPTNTITNWQYDEATSIVTTNFNIETEIKEGVDGNMVMGLLPHQWANLSSNSVQPGNFSYTTIRGELKVVEGNSFEVEHTFRGILPTLPYVNSYSESFDPSKLDSKVRQLENDGLATWTDSYNEGQMMNRLIQTARIADEMGNFSSRDKIVETIKERLEDWLKAENGEVAFIYYYNATWSAMLGYPAGHGQDNNLNDHHFHWGYFIHAAAFVEQFNPGWAEEWGGMIELLIRDAASPDREDSSFPFLRNFSPYAGHSWANGFATFPFGNDQESTSESMQFASSLIHWGSITGNEVIRDLGIYIYTTEQSATEEYWFDVNKRIFKSGYGYQLASRVWGNGYDNQTFWTSDIAAAYGIELYPIHGGSLYLGHNLDYAIALWNEISTNTGILSNEVNPNLWHDTYWKYLSLIDAAAAIELYDSNPDRDLKFGVSDAHTYHWLHSMNVLGQVNTEITANHPLACAFEKDGELIYAAHNYSDTQILVTFSDGYELIVPAKELVTSIDVDIGGVLSSSFPLAAPGGSVLLTATVTGGTATKVEFYNGNTYIGEVDNAPFELRAEDLTLGIHGFYAKVYDGNNFNNTNIVTVQVGEQKPYNQVFQIPGTIDAAHFDVYEGGVGQNISYFDISQNNFGNYRPDEYVDSDLNTIEGPTLGWIDAGEWVEYTINVETSGYYDVLFRFASNNSAGGGPFYFEIDGEMVSPSVNLEYTGGWNDWRNKTLQNVELRQGEHILRIVFENGEFNLGRMQFSYSAPLDYAPPTADAGENVSIELPEHTTFLDGSLSSDPEGEILTFFWEQIYGPTVIIFDDIASAEPQISGLEQGVYKCRLTVSDGEYSDYDEVLVVVTQDGNLDPSVSITSPSDGQSFREGKPIEITASASDIDGSIERVDFYINQLKVGEDASSPYLFEWDDTEIGIHAIEAVAIDNLGGEARSAIVEIEVVDVKSCSETSTTSQQGSFSTGYEATFETVGANVTMTFTLLDTDKVGVVAFLWQEWPFVEYEMENVSGLTFSKTFGGQTLGDELSFACKFAFAGGLAVTKYISYTVGNDCTVLSNIGTEVGDLKIYPNPTQGLLIVEGLSEVTTARIYSSTGTQVGNVNVLDQISLEDFPPGVYFIQFRIGDEIITKRFIKME